jgi:hypothetical protein
MCLALFPRSLCREDGARRGGGKGEETNMKPAPPVTRIFLDDISEHSFGDRDLFMLLKVKILSVHISIGRFFAAASQGGFNCFLSNHAGPVILIYHSALPLSCKVIAHAVIELQCPLWSASLVRSFAGRWGGAVSFTCGCFGLQSFWLGDP